MTKVIERALPIALKSEHMDEGLLPNELETSLYSAFLELRIPLETRQLALELLKPLREKDEAHRAHYEHCIRVGLLAKRIGAYLGIDQKALFFAGIFHDLGKEETPQELLGKTSPWTRKDYQKIRQHPIVGFNKLKDKFPHSAEIIVRHHTFQEDGYPKRLPPYLYDYSEKTKAEINESARILAMADVYDALHRVNSKFGELRSLTDTEIEEQMMRHNPDRVELVRELYAAGIFVNSEAQVPQLVSL